MNLPPLPSSHDNSRLASGGADKTVLLTDVGTGQPIRKFRGHISVSGHYVCLDFHYAHPTINYTVGVFSLRISIVLYTDRCGIYYTCIVENQLCQVQ